jgi:hypothetical protein
VCALAVAILYGSRTQRLAAGAGFAVVAPHIFGGLTQLDVTPVGHLTAVATGAVLGTLLLRSARRADGARAERSRADGARAERSRAERDRAERSSAERDRANHGAEHSHAAVTSAYEATIPTRCPIPNVTAAAAAPSASWRSAPYQTGRFVSRETMPPPMTAAIAEAPSDTPSTGRPTR